jgi:UDP-glucuronate decarboxylase
MAGSQLLGPINLGNPREFSILRTAEMIIEKTKSSSVIVYQDLPSDDPQMRCPDITLAEKVLGWRPSIEIDEGLDNLINWYKSQGEVK